MPPTETNPFETGPFEVSPFETGPFGGHLDNSPAKPVTPPSLSPESTVVSPLGIRLLSGLVAPYLSVAGQRDLQARWGHGAETLFRDTHATVETLRTHPALHAALGVWVRDHTLPAPAATALGHLLAALPLDDAAAQSLLDGWAVEHTNGMIGAFPGQVEATTTAVLGSAVTMDDTWACPTREISLQFAGSQAWGKGFETGLAPWAITATTDGSTVRATLALSSGLQMNFAISTHGTAHAARLLDTPGVFTATPAAGESFVSSRKVEQPTEMVAFKAPAFTTSTLHDLKTDPEPWGLRALLADGAPGLGDLPLSSIQQRAFIEVTHTGVKAAAVTGMMMRSANAMTPPPRPYEQTVVTFDAPFAYEIVAPRLDTPLFTGTYAG